MKFDHQVAMMMNQENGQLFPDLRRYGPLWGSKRGDISLSVLWNNVFSTLPSSDDSISSEWRRQYSGSQMVLHQKCVTIDFAKYSIFMQMSRYQSNSLSNCILTRYTRNCVCTKCSHNSLRCSKNVWNHFLETFRKFEEHFCHDNS